MIHHEHVDLKRVSAPLLYPSTAMTSMATAGSVVVQYAGLSARLALPVVVISYIMAGLGLLTALLVQAVFVARLVEHSVPEPPKKPTIFLMIAPLATAGCASTVCETALTVQTPCRASATPSGRRANSSRQPLAGLRPRLASRRSPSASSRRSCCSGCRSSGC